MRILMLCLTLGSLLASCGFQGPLYLPPAPQPPVSQPSTAH